MSGNLLCVFERSVIKHVRGDTGRAESMAAGRAGEASGLGAALDHVQNVAPRDRILSYPAAFFETPEQRSLFVLTDAGRRNPVM